MDFNANCEFQCELNLSQRNVIMLCELQLFAALNANDILHQHSGTDMAISLLHFTAFFQGEDNSIERGKNHYKSGHVESFSYADEEIVGLVHTSHRECDVTYM